MIKKTVADDVVHCYLKFTQTNKGKKSYLEAYLASIEVTVKFCPLPIFIVLSEQLNN
jgi:hypothetical protein